MGSAAAACEIVKGMGSRQYHPLPAQMMINCGTQKRARWQRSQRASPKRGIGPCQGVPADDSDIRGFRRSQLALNTDEIDV
jgi:hypothetical protein